MVNRCIVFVWLALLAASAGISQHAAADKPVASFPMNRFGSRPIVPVTIGDSGPYPFILDTGAGQSLIDSALADELGLAVAGKTAIQSPLVEQGERSVDRIALGTIAVGGVPFEGIEAARFNLARFIEQEDPPRGVLGYGTFTGYRIVFDYPQNEMRLYGGELGPPDGVRIFQYDGPIPEVPLRFADEEISVHLDTGSPAFINLPLAMAERLPLQSEPAVVGRAMTVDAEFDVYGANMEGSLRIGELQIEEPALMFIEGSPIGHIGNAMLEGLVVTVDPARKRVMLEKPAPAGGEAPTKIRESQRKRYGIRFSGIEGNPLPVVGVEAGSIAEGSGLRAGDQITKLNGRPVEEMDRTARIDALRGSPVEIELLRSEERIVIVLRFD